MKRLAFIIVLALFPHATFAAQAVGNGANTANYNPVLVRQMGICTAFGATTCTLTMPNAPLTGDVLVASAAYLASSGALTSVTCSGCVWTKLADAHLAAGDNPGEAVYYDLSAATGNTSIVFTSPASGNWSASVMEFLNAGTPTSSTTATTSTQFVYWRQNTITPATLGALQVSVIGINTFTLSQNQNPIICAPQPGWAMAVTMQPGSNAHSQYIAFRVAPTQPIDLSVIEQVGFDCPDTAPSGFAGVSFEIPHS